MKTCNRCAGLQPLSEFYPNAKMKDGRLGICKACAKANRAGYVARKGEHIAARMKAYHFANRDRLLAQQREYRAARKSTLAAKKREADTGFSPQHFAATVEAQGRRCGICGIAFRNIGKQQMHADHCHATGAPRGVLCQTCNTALGKFGDSLDTLRSAIAYLENPPAMKTRRT